MSTTIKGSHTRNTSKDLGFYVEYSISDDDENLREVVTATAWIYVGSWGFSGSESGSVTITIGGSPRTISWSSLNCASHYKWYSLGSHTAYFSYGVNNTSVNINASTTDIYCASYGPGRCDCSFDITVSTGCSSAGSIAVTINGEDSATIKATGLQSTTAYRRNVNWWIKPPNGGWSKIGSTPIGAWAAAGTPSFTANGLIPGATYTFDYTLYASTSSVADHTKIFERQVNGTMNQATGQVSLSNVNLSGMTATVSSMKQTTSYARSIKFYYKPSASSSWTLASTKTVAANTTVGTPEYVFQGLIPGTKYDVKVELAIGSNTYKTLGPVSCSLPYAGVSTPEVVAVVQTSPSNVIDISWGLSEVFEDSLDSTQFFVYLQRENGQKIQAGVYTSSDLDEQYKATLSYDASGWLLEREWITVYVEAKNQYASKTSVSNEITIEATRLFYWDTEKVQGNAFGITAQEWNRLMRYINAASALFPGYFDPITYEDVADGDVFTAAIANLAAYAGEANVQPHDTVTAAGAMAIQSSLQQRMEEATGL